MRLLRVGAANHGLTDCHIGRRAMQEVSTKKKKDTRPEDEKVSQDGKDVLDYIVASFHVLASRNTCHSPTAPYENLELDIHVPLMRAKSTLRPRLVGKAGEGGKLSEMRYSALAGNIQKTDH